MHRHIKSIDINLIKKYIFKTENICTFKYFIDRILDTINNDVDEIIVMILKYHCLCFNKKIIEALDKFNPNEVNNQVKLKKLLILPNLAEIF